LVALALGTPWWVAQVGLTAKNPEPASVPGDFPRRPWLRQTTNAGKEVALDLILDTKVELKAQADYYGQDVKSRELEQDLGR